MTSLESKNEMEVMVLTDLAAICKKLAENSALPKSCVQAREFVAQFNALSQFRGEGTASQHFARGTVNSNSAILTESNRS